MEKLESIEEHFNISESEHLPSKSMSGAAEKYRKETIKLQNLQKEFVDTPKDKVAKREKLKAQIMVQNKNAKRALRDFEKIVSTEEDDEISDLFFD